MVIVGVLVIRQLGYGSSIQLEISMMRQDTVENSMCS
jgi:hypothetical protein